VTQEKTDATLKEMLAEMEANRERMDVKLDANQERQTPG
jgi:hypothetical protein